MNIISLFLTFTIFTLLGLENGYGKELKTNAVNMANAPTWLTGTRVDKVVDSIQSKMEWDIHRVEVTWYYDPETYARANTLGSTAIAFTMLPSGAIHLGPSVDNSNFDQIFGHEIVHVISLQKYKGAIPPWLEEGLANYLAKKGTVDYKWLATQPLPANVKELVHPYNDGGARAKYIYMASQALAELIASKCNMQDLLRLSVKRNVENYLATVCGIDDINATFKKWLASH